MSAALTLPRRSPRSPPLSALSCCPPLYTALSLRRFTLCFLRLFSSDFAPSLLSMALTELLLLFLSLLYSIFCFFFLILHFCFDSLCVYLSSPTYLIFLPAYSPSSDLKRSPANRARFGFPNGIRGNRYAVLIG